MGGAVRLRQGPAVGPAPRSDGSGNEVISAVAGPDMVRPARGRGSRGPSTGTTSDEFDVHEGERARPSPRPGPPRTSPFPWPWTSTARSPRRSRSASAWSAGCDYAGPYRAAVTRSLLVLRLLTHGEHRRHRRRPHHVAAGGLRRQPQLGLPLLLAARRLADRRGAAGLRLSTRRRAVAGLAAARHRRRPRGHADHVRRRRRPRAARARADAPARLRRLAAGPASATRRSTSARPTCSAR